MNDYGKNMAFMFIMFLLIIAVGASCVARNLKYHPTPGGTIHATPSTR